MCGLTLAIIPVACGDGDNPGASPGVETVIEQRDEDAINFLVGDVGGALILTGSSLEPLRRLVDESVGDEDLNSLEDCWEMGGEIEMAESADIHAGFDGKARAEFEWLVTGGAGGDADLVRFDWEVDRQEDGSWLLAEAPDCPFLG